MPVMLELLTITLACIAVTITQFLELLKPTASYVRYRYIVMASSLAISLVIFPLYVALEVFNMGYYTWITAFAVVSTCYVALLVDLDTTIYNKRRLC